MHHNHHHRNQQFRSETRICTATEVPHLVSPSIAQEHERLPVRHMPPWKFPSEPLGPVMLAGRTSLRDISAMRRLHRRSGSKSSPPRGHVSNARVGDIRFGAQLSKPDTQPRRLKGANSMRVQPEDNIDQASSRHLRADSSSVVFPPICEFDAETKPPWPPYHYDFGASAGWWYSGLKERYHAQNIFE